MRVALLLPIVLLASCSRPPASSVAVLAPITTESPAFESTPPWLLGEKRQTDITGNATRQWSIQAVVVGGRPDQLTAQGLPIPGEDPRVVTDLGRIAGSEIFGGVCLGPTEGHPSNIEGAQLRQRPFIADYHIKSQKPLPVRRIIDEGSFFQARLAQQGTEAHLATVNIRINRLVATTSATIHCEAGYDLPIEEPFLAAADNTPLTAPLRLGDAPVMVALPLRWTLVRPTAQARAWGTTVKEVTVPSDTPLSGEALVAVVLIRPVAPPSP
jgi:hypothetical protein